MTDTTPVPDPRPAFTAAVAAALPVALHVPADALHRPTPCEDFDVATLRGHLLTVFLRVAHVGRGGALRPAARDHRRPRRGRRPAARRRRRRRGLVRPRPARRDADPPRRPDARPALLATYTGEVLTHTWDLGVSLGRPVEVADDVVAAGAAPSRRILPPGRRPAEFPFGDEVPAPHDATPLERLVAWLGRDPRWTP